MLVKYGIQRKASVCGDINAGVFWCRSGVQREKGRSEGRERSYKKKISAKISK